jgi:hypothetical protein
VGFPVLENIHIGFPGQGIVSYGPSTTFPCRVHFVPIADESADTLHCGGEASAASPARADDGPAIRQPNT